MPPRNRLEPTNGNDRPITLKDLIDAEARIEDRIIQAMDERMQDLETKLLTAFHGYGERTDLRLKRIETAEATTAGRVASLDDVSKKAGEKAFIPAVMSFYAYGRVVEARAKKGG